MYMNTRTLLSSLSQASKRFIKTSPKPTNPRERRGENKICNMGSQTPFKDHPQSLKRKLLPFALYTLLTIALIKLYFSPNSLPLSTQNLSPSTSLLFSTPTPTPKQASESPPPPPLSLVVEGELKKTDENPLCDYTNGMWVHDEMGPLYNSTACSTIKENQNCISHGRPDMGYLYWRWRPNMCQLPRFDPTIFLGLVRNRHVAFVGDSIARNQLESLLCLLATSSAPTLVFTNGDDNKFRKWHFGSHNASVSIYWSPFLVKGEEKSDKYPFNKLHLESVDEVWAKDLDGIDMIVLSFGNWYLHPAFYFYGDSPLGCHYCPGHNFTEIGFYDVFGMALNTTLNAIFDKRKDIDVIVTTFSPAHFEGEWDKLGACSKTMPFKENEIKLEGMNEEMRRIEVQKVDAVKEITKDFSGFRLEALDVTKLSLLRPDGHPGPYMYPFPFANGVKERVQNDCVHWCMPGAIDTWNEILLAIMKRWYGIVL